jgi:hypothetical protein
LAIGDLALKSDISDIALELLINALDDEDYGVRFTAANALDKLNDILEERDNDPSYNIVLIINNCLKNEFSYTYENTLIK